MSEEDAKYHMKRCVDSGLWVADAQAAAAADEEKKQQSETNLDLD